MEPPAVQERVAFSFVVATAVAHDAAGIVLSFLLPFLLFPSRFHYTRTHSRDPQQPRSYLQVLFRLSRCSPQQVLAQLGSVCASQEQPQEQARLAPVPVQQEEKHALLWPQVATHVLFLESAEKLYLKVIRALL